MKRILKNMLSVCLSMMLAAALTIGCTASAWASDSSTLEQQLIQSAEGLTKTIIAMSDDDIANYLNNSSDSFTISAMTAWSDVKDDLGGEKETGETTVEKSNNGEYTVTVPVSFENKDVEFEYVFDKTGTPSTMAVNIQYTLAQNMSMAGMNTIMGLVTVFLVLIFLTFVIWLFRYIPNPDAKEKEADREARELAAVQRATAPAPVQTDGGELAAVIAAAVAAYEADKAGSADNAGAAPASAGGYVVRSIRKIGRNKR